MGDTTETNKKVLSGELFLGAVALQTPIQKNHYMRDKVPFPRYCQICAHKVTNTDHLTSAAHVCLEK